VPYIVVDGEIIPDSELTLEYLEAKALRNSLLKDKTLIDLTFSASCQGENSGLLRIERLRIIWK
jgi:hypothetical protein